MAGTLGKNLNLCFTGIKRPTSSPQSSLQQNSSRPFPNSTISVKNFNCLYDFAADSASTDEISLSDSDITPDIATIFASQRFFFSSPGRSNSIVESSASSATFTSCSSSSSRAVHPEPDVLAGGSIAIPTYSPDPFLDFRRSMQEMVEAFDLIDVRANWDYLHELLNCYLALNPKSTHKFIVGAFADLLVSLMPSPPDAEI